MAGNKVFKSILVALDNSDLSERVVETLVDLNLQPATKIIFSHVISPVETGLEGPADLPSLDPKMGLYRHIEHQLKAFQTRFTCPSELEIVMGDPAEEIIRLANIHRVGLIVIGSRGLTGVRRILQGSVSAQVVTDAQCSVLVVKP
jgi:nucleotide-binding universal stress UspA family protein